MYLENDVSILRGKLKLDKEEKALFNKNLVQEKNKNQGTLVSYFLGSETL